MRGMVPEDVYALTGVRDPRVSRDGRTIAYVVWSIDREANEYRSAIWIAAGDGSSAPRPFTAGEKRDGSPRWSPDGRMLAFTSTRGSGDTAQLYVIPAEGGEAKRLTNVKESVTDHQWSPDGSRIVFVSRLPDEAYEVKDEKRREPRRFTRLSYKLDNEGWIGDRRQHLFVVAADGESEPVQITKGDHEFSAPSWSPDGTRLAFSAGLHDDWDIDLVRDVYVVDAGGGQPERITSSDGGCDAPSWSPDGSAIAFRYTPGLYDEPRHGRIAVIDTATRERRVLTESLDRNCWPYPDLREPIWDGADLVFAVEDRGNTHLYRVPADGSAEPALAVGGERTISGYDVAGGVIVYAATDPRTLAELFVDDRKLTDVGSRFAEEREIVAPERFTATSADGSEVEAWVMRPTGLEPGKRYPVLLNIHGGPFTQYGNRFFDEFQVLTGAGYVVVFGNPRGSSGYSEEWGRAIRGPVEGGPGWGSVDYDDCMAVIEEAVRRFDFCDPDRLGVMGGSYGGYMTSWIVGHTDRFKAAISERAVNSMVSEFGSSDFGHSLRWVLGAYLWEDYDAYVKVSPATYAQNITTPLLILHSENDLRCNIEQGEHLFTMLRVMKKDVEMVRFPAESHELSRSGSPVHRVMRFETILDWLDRRLRD